MKDKIYYLSVNNFFVHEIITSLLGIKIINNEINANLKMTIFLIIILFIMIHLIFSQHSYLLFPIQNENSLITIKVIINSNSLHFLLIDQSQNLFLISDANSQIDSSSYEPISINDSFLNVKESTNLIVIDSFKTNNVITYYLYNSREIKESLGLASSFLNTRMSLVHNLYSSNDISKRQYGFIFNDDKDGYIFFGEYPIKSDKVIQCRIYSKNYITWNCDLQYIKMASKSIYKNSHYSYFDIKEEGILVPFSFYEHFELYLDVNFNDNCKNLVGDHRYSFRCKSTYIKTLPAIEFSFDGNSLYFDTLSLFKCNNTSKNNFDCDSYIYYDGTVKDTFIFGYAFIKQYITVFDYDGHTVSFYDNNFTNSKVKGKIKKFDLFNIIFLIISMMLKFYN